MKKNRMMRLASGLLVAVLLTTSVISGTFAKYTTSQTGTDTARVAKWGVTITANGTTFATSYENDEEIGTNAVGTVNAVNNGSSDSMNLVAPGTKGELVECVLGGTPEVAVEVIYDATVTLENWEVDGSEYCPIVFKVNGDEFKIEAGSAIPDIGTLKTKVEEAIEAYSAKFAANQDLSQEGTVSTPDVEWEWPFEIDDAKDTKLGEQAHVGNWATITVEIETTVNQLN